MKARGLAALLCGALIALAGCGGSEDTGATGAPATAGFPREIRSRLGTVTVQARPQRVVALDFPSADAALSAGVVPVGMLDVTYVDGGIQAWTRAALGDRPAPALIDTTDGFPFERIAALKPDVILATNTFPLLADAWDRLNAIAPVVGHIEAPGSDRWQDDALLIGRALGREDRMQREVQDAERTVEEARERNAGAFDGATVSIFNYVDGDGLYVINDDKDASLRFFRDLGFRGAPADVLSIKGQGGRGQLSAETYDRLEADVVVGTSPAPDGLDRLERAATFKGVPAIGRGAWVPTPIGPITAMAFPSVLAVPYAVDEVVPKVAEAMAER